MEGRLYLCPYHSPPRERLNMRWFKEWRTPGFKCARLGHKPKDVIKRIRRKCSGTFAVVEDFDAEFTICTRCGFTVGPDNEKKVDSFTSCTMPDTYWEHIRKKGYVILRGEGRPG